MTVKVAINGLGRIGRTILKESFNRENKDFEIVAVNNPGDKNNYIHLLRYDSVHRHLNHISFDYDSIENNIIVNGKSKIKFYDERDPASIPWSDQKVDIVIDATGIFRDKSSLSAHLGGSVKKVVLCAPGKSLDGTFVMGINTNSYNPSNDHIISNASCTTNCLAPVAKVLNDKYGIVKGFMTTVHAYTSDQNLLDSSHSDPRRGRSAAMSIIPTTTGAAKAVGLVIPELIGKLDGFAIRVPTPNVSLVDISVELKKDVTTEEVNNTLIAAAKGELKGILKTEATPLVSIDYSGMRESSCVDLALTNTIGKNMVKVVTWYDNEAGFSNRVIDLVTFVGSKL